MVPSTEPAARPGEEPGAARVAALPLALALAVLFGPILLSGDVVYGFDVVHEKLFWHEWVWATWLRGEIPTWNRHHLAGVPFLQLGNASPVYPLAAVHALLPPVLATNLLVVAHLVLLGAGCHRLVRTLGGDAWGGALAATAAALGGFAIGRVFLGSLPQLFALAWAPWAWAAVETGLRSDRTVPFVGAAAAMGLAWLAGHPQFSVLGPTAAVVHTAARLPDLETGARLRASARLAAAIALGAALGAAQLLPLLDAAADASSRDGPEGVLVSALPLWQLPQLAIPRLFGTAVDTVYHGHFLRSLLAAHVGVVPLLLLVALGSRLVRPPHRAPLLVGACGLFLALDTGLGGWVRSLPPFAFFRLPSRWLGLAALALPVLAGLGLTSLRHRERVPPPTLALLVGPAIAAAVILAILAGTGGSAGAPWRSIRDLADATLRLYPDGFLDDPATGRAGYAIATSSLVLFSVVAGITALGLALLPRLAARLGPAPVAFGVVLLATIDLAHEASPYVRPFSGEELELVPPLPRLREVDATGLPGRVASGLPDGRAAPPRRPRPGLRGAERGRPGLLPPVHGDGGGRGPGRLPPPPARPRARRLGPALGAELPHQPDRPSTSSGSAGCSCPRGGASPSSPTGSASPSPGSSTISSSWSAQVRSTSTATPGPCPGSSSSATSGAASSPTRRSRASGPRTSDPARRRWSRGTPPGPFPAAPGPDHLSVERRGDRRMRIEATLGGPGLLVVSERWDAGWRARVDGIDQDVLRVDGVVQGVELAAGRHVVELLHRPWYAIPGLAITSIVAAGMLVGCLREGRRRGRA